MERLLLQWFLSYLKKGRHVGGGLVARNKNSYSLISLCVLVCSTFCTRNTYMPAGSFSKLRHTSVRKPAALLNPCCATTAPDKLDNVATTGDAPLVCTLNTMWSLNGLLLYNRLELVWAPVSIMAPEYQVFPRLLTALMR